MVDLLPFYYHFGEKGIVPKVKEDMITHPEWHDFVGFEISRLNGLSMNHLRFGVLAGFKDQAVEYIGVKPEDNPCIFHPIGKNDPPSSPKYI